MRQRNSLPRFAAWNKKVETGATRPQVRPALKRPTKPGATPVQRQIDTMKTEYETQAEQFLGSNGLKLRITLSDSKTASWQPSGHHYRVTLSRGKQVVTWKGIGGTIPGFKRGPRLTFDFFGSFADAHCECCKGTGKIKLNSPKPIHVPNPRLGHFEWTGHWSPPSVSNGKRGKLYHKITSPEMVPSWETHEECTECKGSGKTPTPKAPTSYCILACLSSDAHCPDTFSDWCSEYGYDEDSLKAKQTWKRCYTFAKRLQAFFTPAELEQLAEIQ